MPHNLVRLRGELLARHGLPFKRSNFAGRQEELRCGYRVRNLSTRAIPQIENQFVQALLVKLHQLIAQFRDVRRFQSRQTHISDIIGDAVGHNMLRPNHPAIDTYFLRLRLAAPHHCHFHRSARRALQQHCRLAYRHIARTESAVLNPPMASRISPSRSPAFSAGPSGTTDTITM